MCRRRRPFLLQARASYTAIGIFSLAAYPYSFKLAWSPVVDSVRESVQAVSGHTCALAAAAGAVCLWVDVSCAALQLGHQRPINCGYCSIVCIPILRLATTASAALVM